MRDRQINSSGEGRYDKDRPGADKPAWQAPRVRFYDLSSAQNNRPGQSSEPGYVPQS